MNTSNAPQCWKNRPRTKKGQIFAWWSTKYSWILNSESNDCFYLGVIISSIDLCESLNLGCGPPGLYLLPMIACFTQQRNFVPFYSFRFNSTKQPWICIKKFCRSYFSTAAKWESAATKMGHSVRSEKCIYSHFAIKYSFSGQRARVGQQQRRAVHFFVSILERTSWEKREWLLVFKIQRILNHNSKLVIEWVWFWGQWQSSHSHTRSNKRQETKTFSSSYDITSTLRVCPKWSLICHLSGNAVRYGTCRL